MSMSYSTGSEIGKDFFVFSTVQISCVPRQSLKHRLKSSRSIWIIQVILQLFHIRYSGNICVGSETFCSSFNKVIQPISLIGFSTHEN